MKPILAGCFAVSVILAGCGSDRTAGWGTFASEQQGEPRVFEVKEEDKVVQYRMPDVRHIVDTPRSRIVERADIIFFCDPNSKFGNLIFKHRRRWYSCGGFLAGTSIFIHDEARIHGGVVVFVTPDASPFNLAGKGPHLAGSLIRNDPSAWDFYYIERERFGESPESRHYFDTDNKKITYQDY